MSPAATGPPHSGGAGTQQLREQGATSREPEQQLDSHRPEGAEEWHTLCQACRDHMLSLAPGLSLGDGNLQEAEPVEEVVEEAPPGDAQYPVMFMGEDQWRSFTSALEEFWLSRHRRHFEDSEN